jgi:NitT/TauT family transport system permease protein
MTSASAKPTLLDAAAPGVATPPHRLRSASRRLGRSTYLRGIVMPLLVVLAWQLIAATHVVHSTFLPSPAEVASAFWTWAFGPRSDLNWTSGTFVEFSLMSMRRVFSGFAIGASLGLLVGVTIGWYRLASDLLDPLVQMLRPIPMTAWLPFATLLFGVKESAAIFLIAMGCFFPVVLNTAAGARQTPRLLVRAALMLGTKPRRLLTRVVIPAALPSIVTGLRLGLGISWVLVIVAEMLAVKGGLGFAVWSAYTFIRMDLILAAIFAMGFFGWLSDQILVRVAARMMRWQSGLVTG